MTPARSQVASSGWLLFLLGMISMFFFGALSIATYVVTVPLFMMSFILAVVALFQGRVLSGMALLAGNLIVAPTTFYVLFWASFFGGHK